MTLVGVTVVGHLDHHSGVSHHSKHQPKASSPFCKHDSVLANSLIMLQVCVCMLHSLIWFQAAGVPLSQLGIQNYNSGVMTCP